MNLKLEAQALTHKLGEKDASLTYCHASVDG